MLRALVFALAVLLPCSIAATSADAAKKKKPTACQRLKGNGAKPRDLAPATSVKLVRRFNGDNGTDLLGCVLPAGKVRRIASSSHYETGDFRYSFGPIAGRIVLISYAGGNQYAYDQSTSVWDLRSGRSYTIDHLCSMTGGGDCGSGGSTISGPVFITGTGRAVAAISAARDGNPVPAGPVTIVSFSPGGRRTNLDAGEDIPAASLTLTARSRRGRTAVSRAARTSAHQADEPDEQRRERERRQEVADRAAAGPAAAARRPRPRSPCRRGSRRR